MTKLHPVKAHVRRSPEPNPRRREMLDRLQFEVAFMRLENYRVGALLVAALEEALAEFKPEEA
jgi:hypothetical protein